jgi:TorA maturation chaperone TorD
VRDSGGQIDAPGIARIRQGTFRLLAAGYGRPSSESTASIATGAEALAGLEVGVFAFARPVFDWVGRLDEADLCALVSEHVRLFGSGMDGALCAPIESQHVGSNLHGDPARYSARIEGLLRRSGLTHADDGRPPDHLVVELELMSAWCGHEAAAWEAGSDSQRWIELELELLGYLGVWVPGFAAGVAAEDRTGVFSALGRATAAVVDHDADILRMLVREVEAVG